MAKRRQYSTKFQAKVALEAIRGDKTLSQIASANKIHPNQVSKWKARALEGLPSLFERASNKPSAQFEEDDLLRQIGRLQVELEFLKKNSSLLG